MTFFGQIARSGLIAVWKMLYRVPHSRSQVPLADHSSLFVFVVNILDNLLVRIKVFVSFDTSSHYSAMARRMYICISGYIFKGEWVKILLMQYSAAVFGLRVYGVDLYFD